MGCNCKVNKQISKIYKNYGYKNNVSWKTSLNFSFIESIKTLLIIKLLLICLPLFFVLILYKSANGKSTFNINKILKKYLRK
jgi:hypothetical protein